ncbi:hypothetical protein OHT57_13285 [Streptomyces sp. NBC_00285]|uniref:hypothetical protein n=1 Tax=Streptomyces sp. NBC_00285 TaxID=2975700 RepID=UPI002E2E509E|nr:hypothetical protein [Streptomyces sp. NBC_00285]
MPRVMQVLIGPDALACATSSVGSPAMRPPSPARTLPVRTCTWGAEVAELTGAQ